MKTLLSICFLVSAFCADAQWVTIYSQATAPTITMVIQTNAPAPVCQLPSAPCNHASHTYTVSVTMTSPNGLQTPGTRSGTYAATYAPVYVADSESMDGETGDFTFSFQGKVICTIAGLLFQQVLASMTWEHKQTITYFTDAFATPIGPLISCSWAKLDCDKGQATCKNGFAFNGPQFNVGAILGCPDPVRAIFDTYRNVGANGGWICNPFAWAGGVPPGTVKTCN